MLCKMLQKHCLGGDLKLNNYSPQKLAAEVFSEFAQTLRTGESIKKVKVGLTTLGSEIPILELVQGAYDAMSKNSSLEVVLIGPKIETHLDLYEADDEDRVRNILGDLLDQQVIDGAVTMHYPFPIGVATVGKVITPARGKVMYIATTTGTSDTNRIQAMVKNAVYGIATAKADGIKDPTVGILNVEGARQVERYLTNMYNNGYNFTWGQSKRIDGGQILRGNDLILGSVDVLVTDTLTGNILMKLFSSFNSGGVYETVGYGYGPGVGENLKRLICILSRASGTPVVANAISYCASMVRGNLAKIVEKEIKLAQNAGWQVDEPNTTQQEEDIPSPPEKVTDAEITGVDILEVDDAVKALWKNKIYASSGMGCTGPVILVAAEDHNKSIEVLKANQYI